MKPSRLFRSIVVVGASLTAAALLVPLLFSTAGCDSQVQPWPIIDLPMPEPRDLKPFWPDIGVPQDLAPPEDMAPTNADAK
jgi:hypothetical protein